MPTAHELVARGAELLDEKLPGWADQIDLDTLAMEDGCQCVLGQLGQRMFNLDAESWHRAVAERVERHRPVPKSPYERMFRKLRVDPEMCGFNAPNDQPDAANEYIDFDDLQDAWKGEIVARRTLGDGRG